VEPIECGENLPFLPPRKIRAGRRRRQKEPEVLGRKGLRHVGGMVAEPFTASRQLTHCTLLDLTKVFRFHGASKKLSTHKDCLSEMGKSLLWSSHLPCGRGGAVRPETEEN